jgi:hypothetical protein
VKPPPGGPDKAWLDGCTHAELREYRDSLHHDLSLAPLYGQAWRLLTSQLDQVYSALFRKIHSQSDPD